MLKKCIGLAVFGLIATPGFALCQSPVGAVVLHIEPFALGVRCALSGGAHWGIGPQLIVGPVQGVTVGSRQDSGDLKVWASAYLSVTGAIGSRLKLVVAPLGAAAVVGNDFAVIYPAGQLGIDYRVDRLLVGSDLRVTRIAGSNGSGDYWVQWIPLRVGITLGKRAA